ncbi:MAG: hypothetical protein HY765_02755 [Rhodomicrobium sp.]|nr:hypothetical protein [Rhodomicrobium sp.]
MSITHTESLFGESASYGGFVDAIGGIATVALAVVGLAGTASGMMAAIATVVFGAALLIQGGAMLSEYARIIFPQGAAVSSNVQFGGGSLSAVFLAGAAGIVLGILALLGLNPNILTAAAVIAFGVALVLSSNSVWHLHMIKRSALSAGEQASSSGAEILAHEMAFGSASVPALAGLSAIVLGILGLAGLNTVALTLVALLAIGGALIVTGSTLSTTVQSFMRPATPTSLVQPRA